LRSTWSYVYVFRQNADHALLRGLSDNGHRLRVSSRDDMKSAVRVAMAVGGVKAVSDEMQLK
jgi:hypothetical protein